MPNRSRAMSTLAAMALIAAACGSPATSGSTNDPARDPVPQVAVATFAGDRLSLTEFEGRPLVVNFWATWCPSCVAEMSRAFRPAIASLEGGVAFVGVNIQDDRAAAEALLAETGVEWVNTEDEDGELYAALGGLGMPFTVVVDDTGSIVHRHNGPLDERKLLTLIEDVTRS